MSDYVFAVLICAECGTQMFPDDCGDTFCVRCDSIAAKEVRFVVARSAVLAAVKPHEAVVEETLYFGCWQTAGHYYWKRSSGGRLVSLHPDEKKTATPWGMTVDGGLFARTERLGVGRARAFHKDGWTALAFEDNSIDRRPGSWSVFCIPDVLDAHDALFVAKKAYPEIFARYEFEVVVA